MDCQEVQPMHSMLGVGLPAFFSAILNANHGVFLSLLGPSPAFLSLLLSWLASCVYEIVSMLNIGQALSSCHLFSSRPPDCWQLPSSGVRHLGSSPGTSMRS